MLYFICATYKAETGQDWKIAALTFIICVHFFCRWLFMIDYYEKVLYTLALRALRNDEIPVAAPGRRQSSPFLKTCPKQNGPRKTGGPFLYVRQRAGGARPNGTSLLWIFHLIRHLLRKCHLAALSKSLIWVTAPMQGTPTNRSASRDLWVAAAYCSPPRGKAKR